MNLIWIALMWDSWFFLKKTVFLVFLFVLEITVLNKLFLRIIKRLILVWIEFDNSKNIYVNSNNFKRISIVLTYIQLNYKWDDIK